MNLPFKFTFAATNDYGILWNPYSLASNGTDKVNSVLSGLTDLMAASVLPPLGEVYLQGLSIMTDDTGAAPVTLGWYDTETDTFHALYPILTTALAGGGIADLNLDPGFYLPTGPTVFAALRMDGAGAGVVSGHVRLYVPPPSTQAGPGQEVGYLLDSNGKIVTDENNHPLLNG